MSEALTIPELGGKVSRLLAEFNAKLSRCEVCRTNCAQTHPDSPIFEKPVKQKIFVTEPCIADWIDAHPRSKAYAPWTAKLPQTYREYVATACAFAEKDIRLDSVGFLETRYEQNAIVQGWKLEETIAKYLRQTRNGSERIGNVASPIQELPVMIGTAPARVVVPAEAKIIAPAPMVLSPSSPPYSDASPARITEMLVPVVPISQPKEARPAGKIYQITETEFERIINGNGPLSANYSKTAEKLMSVLLKRANCDSCGKTCIIQYPHHAIWENGDRLSAAGCSSSGEDPSWKMLMAKYPGQQYDKINLDIFMLYACATILAPKAHNMTPKRFFDGRHDLLMGLAEKNLLQSMWDKSTFDRHTHEKHPGDAARCSPCSYYKDL